MSWIHDTLDIPEDQIDQFETACEIEAKTNMEDLEDIGCPNCGYYWNGSLCRTCGFYEAMLPKTYFL